MQGAKAGVPVNVQVAVGRSGIGVISHYTWEPLGLTLALVQASQTGEARPPGRQRLTGLTVTLKNHGAAPVAIVPGVGGRLLRLVPDQRRADSGYEWVGAGRPVPEPKVEDLVELAPGEHYEVTLNLEDQPWFVRERNGERRELPLGDLENVWSAWFRVEYRPPDVEATAGWPQAPLIRRLPLRSRAFSPAGAVD